RLPLIDGRQTRQTKMPDIPISSERERGAMRSFQLRPILAAIAIAQGLLLGMGCTGARAANFPAPGRSITLMVPYAPGGGTDTGARLMAAALEPLLKTSVQVVNRPGAGSEVGLTQLVRAKP